MSAIFKLIRTFTPEQQQQVIQFLTNKNRRGDTKNIDLFKKICKGEILNLHETLYKNPNRNAYHALSKRLLDNLIDFIATKSFSEEAGEEMTTLKLILASRILFEQKLNKLGWKTICRAENLAISYDLYTALHEIYDTQLQYAHLFKNVDFEDILAKSSDNLKHLNSAFKLQQAYAFLKNHLQSNTPHANMLLEETFERFNISPKEEFTYKSLFQFMELLSDTAELESDYYRIAPLMQEAFAYITQKNTSEKHLYYHLQILYLMASNSFRNKDFKESLDYLDELDHLLTDKYRNQFQISSAILRSLAMNYMGIYTQAISLCENLNDKSPRVLLLLMTLYFQQNKFKESYAIYKKLNHSDQFYEKQLGFLWVVKKEIIALLLLIELDKLDLVLQKQNAIRKKFHSKLSALGEERVMHFIKLAGIYYDNPQFATSTKFHDQVENSFKWIGVDREDLFAMSFYAWLKSKMEKRDLYVVTLELVNQTNYSL
ncbi:hypothetical protein ACFSYG_07610 [Leeuwenhoekiella polynyae]|uniref:Tetratricopeptide repeat protein n=1 Tax=Leeuwenhoekiella polynyae TaxID=1550906 RepID=A0A4Q0P1H7_9FLAO|nr:hypothetical protein [Leeuwenhoekiella polynyae]RXG20015.1 hypothetical protein DSM02_2860 [Leeuwenhoekiella polynyae]